MAKTIILKEETTMDEVFMSHLINEEPLWHKRGIDLTGDNEDGLLSEDRSFGD